MRRHVHLLNAAAVGLLSACGPSAPEHPFLWRIERDPPAWLYGTIHVPDPRVTVLPDVVVDAIDASDQVWGELEMGPSIRTAVQKAVLLPDDKTLKDVLPEDVHAELLAYLAEQGVPVATVERLKPWVVATQLAIARWLDPALLGRPALDFIVLERARAEGKETGGIETVEEQIAAFEVLTEDEQTQMLRESIAFLRGDEADTLLPIEELLRVYLAGDHDALVEKAAEWTNLIGSPELNAKLLDSVLSARNVRMAERVAAKLEQHADRGFLFAFGALHMPGDDGVVALLRKKGYEVVRIAAPEPAAK